MVSEFSKGCTSCVELFSGNADITKALIDKGFNCVSVDYDPSKKPMLCRNVYNLSDAFLKQFSFIWLSPDCTTYSLASHGIHRKRGGLPVSGYARECDKNNTALFEQLKRLNIPFIAENPRGHFRNMPFVNGLSRKTVFYSTYGAEYTKPTDLFSNRADLLEVFNPEYIKGSKHLDCINYNDFLGRCKMPPKLIDDICKAVEIAVKGSNHD